MSVSCVCAHLCMQVPCPVDISRHLRKLFSESHMLFFKRWPAVKNIHRRPAQDLVPAVQSLPIEEHQAEKKNSPLFKSQALISVNHILCKTLPLVCSWNSSKYQSGSSWPYKEKKGGIQAGLAKAGQTQTFLAYYQHTAFCA